MAFPESFTLTVRRERHQYVVSSTEPLLVTARGPSIASGLFNWCVALRRAIEQRGMGVEAQVMWQSGATRRHERPANA